MQTDLLSKNTPLSPEDMELEKEIDSEIAGIEAYQAQKWTYLNEYAQVKAEQQTKQHPMRVLKFPLRCLIENLEKLDSSISSQKEESLKKCEIEFSNKEYAKEILVPLIHIASKRTRDLEEKMTKLQLYSVETTNGYVNPDYLDGASGGV